MSKTKLFAGVLLVLALLFAQVGTALAAPVAQDTTTNITGTIVSVITETDENGTTVLVTYLDAEGVEQKVRLSLEAAVTEGLVTVDTTTNTVTVVAKSGDALDIEPDGVIPDAEEPTDEYVHPIAAILAKFFSVEPGVVQGYHDDGYGFGVIAQAMWMAQGLGEGETVVDAGLILEAKKTGDYSAFTLPDGSTPTNWGQFKKAAMGKDKKNLGIIVSGHADPLDETETEAQTLQNNGKGNGKDNNPGKGKGKNKNP